MPSLVDLQFINYLWLVIYLPLGGKIESNLFWNPTGFGPTITLEE